MTCSCGQSVDLGTVGKVRRSVGHAPTDQQQRRTFPAERCIGPQQRRQALFGTTRRRKEGTPPPASPAECLRPRAAPAARATADNLIKDEIRYNAGVRAARIRLPSATALLKLTTWSMARFFHGRISAVAAAVSGPRAGPYWAVAQARHRASAGPAHSEPALSSVSWSRRPD